MLLLAFTILNIAVMGQIEQWVPCVPDASHIELDYRKENGASYVDVSIEFPSSGFNISDWGTPTTIKNNISADARIWRWTGVDLPVVITRTHAYNLGNLPTGDYLFTFKVWGFSVKNITFTVSIIVPDDYPIIQEAINHANEGDTVFVRNGKYYENVVVNKTLSLIGEDRRTTIIDGNDTGTVIAVYADFVTISGFSIQHSGFYVGLPSGIEVGASNCTIIDNIVVLNKGGVSLLFGGNHTVLNNVISSSYYGINIIYSENNRVFHNCFLNNTQHVYITGSINKWDDGYPSGGNYWSNYTVADLYHGPYQNETGSDGIGDKPYVIDENNVDKYPLMKPWTSLIGDVNRDSIVDMADISIIIDAFLAEPGHPRWNPDADLNQDRIIDSADISIAIDNFLKE
jgi:parallel beta-helix repeat protein